MTETTDSHKPSHIQTKLKYRSALPPDEFLEYLNTDAQQMGFEEYKVPDEKFIEKIKKTQETFVSMMQNASDEQSKDYYGELFALMLECKQMARSYKKLHEESLSLIKRIKEAVESPYNK